MTQNHMLYEENRPIGKGEWEFPHLKTARMNEEVGSYLSASVPLPTATTPIHSLSSPEKRDLFRFGLQRQNAESKAKALTQ